MVSADFLFSPFIPNENFINAFPVEADANDCIDQVLSLCQSNFNEQLYISSSADWSDYRVLKSELENVLAQGVDDGLLKLCRARSLFYQCLGSSYDSCISRFHFLEKGFSNEAAWGYIEIFRELEFICNGGILQSLRSWDCIRTWKTYAENQYATCDLGFKNFSIYDPVNLCYYAEEMILCARQPYYEHCGADVGWWECERARIALNIDTYCPHLSCSYEKYQPSTAPKLKLKSRFELYRSPDTQFMSPQKVALFAQLGAKAEERLKRKKRSIEK